MPKLSFGKKARLAIMNALPKSGRLGARRQRALWAQAEHFDVEAKDLVRSYQLSGDPTNLRPLDDAIRAAREAVHLGEGEDNSRYPAYLAHLARYLRLKYEETKEDAVIIEAAKLAEQAVKLTPIEPDEDSDDESGHDNPEHPAKRHRIYNKNISRRMDTLAQVYAKKYYETRAIDDFEHAGRNFIDAIEIAEEDDDNHHYGRYTYHLAGLYESRYHFEGDVTALDAGIRLITLTLETLEPEDRDWANCVETGAKFHELRYQTNGTVYDRERVLEHYLLLFNETPETKAKYPAKSRTKAFPEYDDMFEEHAKWQFMLGDSAWKLYLMGGTHEDITQLDAIHHMRMGAERTQKNTPERESRMAAVHEALEHTEVSQGNPGANTAINEAMQKLDALDIKSSDRAQALEQVSRAYDARFKVREFGDDLKNALKYAYEAYQATHPDHHHDLAAILRYVAGLQHLLWQETGKDAYIEDAIHYGKRAVRQLTDDETGDEVFRHEVLSFLAHILARKYEVTFAAEPESMSTEGLTQWLDRLPLNISEDGESSDSTGPYESENEKWPVFEPYMEESESDSGSSMKSSKK